MTVPCSRTAPRTSLPVPLVSRHDRRRNPAHQRNRSAHTHEHTLHCNAQQPFGCSVGGAHRAAFGAETRGSSASRGRWSAQPVAIVSFCFVSVLTLSLLCLLLPDPSSGPALLGRVRVHGRDGSLVVAVHPSAGRVDAAGRGCGVGAAAIWTGRCLLHCVLQRHGPFSSDEHLPAPGDALVATE